MANSIGSQGNVISGSKAVATAGTAVVIGTQVWKSVVIVAKAANTGQIYVGGSDVANTTNAGLDAGDVLVLESEKGIDLATLYIDAGTSSDGIDFYGVK